MDVSSWTEGVSLPLVAAAVTAVLLIEYWRRTRGLPPGPWSLPFIGYYSVMQADYFVHIKELWKQYGDVLSFRVLGGSLVVVISGTPLVKEVMINRADEFNGRPVQYNLLNWIDGGENRGIAQTEGQTWKEQRRFFLSTVKNFGYGKVELEGFIHELIRKMIRDIGKTAGKSFEPSPHIRHITCSTIGKVAGSFQPDKEKDSVKLKFLSEGYHQIQWFLLKDGFFLLGPILALWMKLMPSGREMTRKRDKILQMIKDIVQEHVSTFDPSSPRDYIDAYLSCRKSLEEKGELQTSSFTMERLYAIIFNTFLDGMETADSVICLLLCSLCQHVEAQKRAQKELDDVVGHARLPSWTDRPNTPYVDALILELHRMNPALPLSVFFTNYEETKIRGYRIPKRTLIVANFWSISNDPKLFPNPSRFEPERFLGADGKKKKQEGPIPFGVGKRSCVGEPLAQMEIYLIISAILQNFTIYPGEKEGQIRAEKRENAPF